MKTLSYLDTTIPPYNNYIAIGHADMHLSDIQEYYDRVCRKYNLMSVKAYLVHSDEESIRLTGQAMRKLDYKGLYIHWPFRKIFLNANQFDIDTVYHEIFHHLHPNLNDGPKFERMLKEFIKYEYI